MLKSISVVAAVAAALCFATTAYAASKGPQTEEDNRPPKPLPPLQKNFPLDQTWSLQGAQRQARAPWIGHQPEDRRDAARLRLHRLQFVVGDDVSGQGPASRHRALCADQEAVRQGPYALESDSCPRCSAAQSGTWSTATSSSRGRAARCGSPARFEPGPRSGCGLRLGDNRGRGAVVGFERDPALVELVDRRLMANRDNRGVGQRFDDRAIEVGLALLVERGG